MKSIHLEADGVRYTVDLDRLSITRGNNVLASFSIAPVIEGAAATISEWNSMEPGHFTAALARDNTVHFALQHSLPCYWLETSTRFLRKLTYFSDGILHGGSWHSFVPDEWDRTWECKRDIEVAASGNYLTGSVDGDDGAGMTDPGDRPPTWIFNIPAHFCALKASKNEWMGFCMPYPHALGVVRYRMDHERFSLSFEAVQASCPESGCPRVYLQAGMREPYELCDRHYTLSKIAGLTKTNALKTHPDWWGHPYYKSYDDQLRTEREEGGYSGHLKMVDGKLRSVLNTARIRKWHSMVEEQTGLTGKLNVFLDQIYFNHYGGYDKVNEDLGGIQGLRKTIDEWRTRGVRTGLYFHPFTVSKDADFFKQHPEACLATNSLGVEYRHGVSVGSSGSAYFDWTHPATREFLLNTVEFLLSDKPGCLNADWLGINNTYGPDPRYYEFHDPDWGVGDLMHMKVQKLIYEKAKSVKPDCLVRRQSALAPFMEPYYDEAQLCEEWNGSTLNWWRRLRIASRLIRNNILGSDPWFVTLTKGYEYYHGFAAVTVPAMEASSHAIHPYIYWRPLQEKDFKRRKAGIQAYMNAPQWISDDKRVELTDEDSFITAWRKRTEGPLAGFYAALALSPRCIVTYDETRALVAASESRTADIPLPPQAKLKKVERVTHEGETAPHDYDMIDPHTLRTHVEDACGNTLYLRIVYSIE